WPPARGDRGATDPVATAPGLGDRPRAWARRHRPRRRRFLPGDPPVLRRRRMGHRHVQRLLEHAAPDDHPGPPAWPGHEPVYGLTPGLDAVRWPAARVAGG